jgi:hypothetical protein
LGIGCGAQRRGLHVWTTIELETFKPVVLEADEDDDGELRQWNRIVRGLRRRRGSSQDTVSEDTDLRIIAVRKSDSMPDVPASRSWPRLGTYTRYTFEVELSRELTKAEMESAQMLFGSPDFRFSPPKTFKLNLTTEEMEQRLPDILFMLAMARQAIKAGREFAEQSKVDAAAEVARVDEALARMNAKILEDTGLAGGNGWVKS